MHIFVVNNNETGSLNYMATTYCMYTSELLGQLPILRLHNTVKPVILGKFGKSL